MCVICVNSFSPNTRLVVQSLPFEDLGRTLAPKLYYPGLMTLFLWKLLPIVDINVTWPFLGTEIYQM